MRVIRDSLGRNRETQQLSAWRAVRSPHPLEPVLSGAYLYPTKNYDSLTTPRRKREKTGTEQN